MADYKRGERGNLQGNSKVNIAQDDQAFRNLRSGAEAMNRKSYRDALTIGRTQRNGKQSNGTNQSHYKSPQGVIEQKYERTMAIYIDFDNRMGEIWLEAWWVRF